MAKLVELINSLFLARELDGVGSAGVINIESGMVQVGDRYFGNCSCLQDSAFARDCLKCGRTGGNHLSFLAGRGDGVYSGINLWTAQGATLLASIYVFDEQLEFADAMTREVLEQGTEFQLRLAEATENYWNLPCAVVGEVRSDREQGVLVGDTHAGLNDPFAVVSLWGSVGRDYSLFIAFERYLASAMVQTAIHMGADEEYYSGGFADSLRPRVAILVQTPFARSWESDPGLVAHDWQRQFDAWNRAAVAANLGGGNNLSAITVNGMQWRHAQQRQFKLVGQRDSMWSLYGLDAFGWFVQGAVLGDEDCRVAMVDMIRESGGDLLRPEIVADALSPRGWEATPEVLAFVRSAAVRD